MGSSMNSTAGRWKIARATMSRCAIPPDRAYTDALAHLDSWNCSSSSSAIRRDASRADAEQPPVEVEVFPDGELAVEGVLLGHDPAELLGQRRVGHDVDPRPEAPPEVGTTRVVSIPAVVVLPAPLGPSRPKISPAWTFRLSPSTAEVRARVDLGQVDGADDGIRPALGEVSRARGRWGGAHRLNIVAQRCLAAA